MRIGTKSGARTLWSRGFNPRQMQEIFSSTASRPDLGTTQPPIQRVPGALSSRVKRQGRETGHLFYLTPRLRIVELYLNFPIRLHSVVKNSKVVLVLI
jgi:hypothetical protein